MSKKDVKTVPDYKTQIREIVEEGKADTVRRAIYEKSRKGQLTVKHIHILRDLRDAESNT